MLSGCEAHDAPVCPVCPGRRGVRCCRQWQHGERGAWRSVQGLVTQSAQGGGLLGLVFTLQVQPYGDPPAAAKPAGDGEGAVWAWALLRRPQVTQRTWSFCCSMIHRGGWGRARAGNRQAQTG